MLILRPCLLTVLPWTIMVLLFSCTTGKDASPPVKNEVVAVTTLLSTIADDELPQRALSSSDHGAASTAEGQAEFFRVVFSEFGNGVAYLARVGEKMRVVHNGVPGRLYEHIVLNTLQISPDGRRVVYGIKQNDKYAMIVDGKETGQNDELYPPVFSPDSRHLAFETRRGETSSIIVDGRSTPTTISYYDKPVFSADSTKILYIENTREDLKKRLVVCTNRLRELAAIPVFAQSIAMSGDRSRVAAVGEHNGNYRVLEFSFDDPGSVKQGPLYDSVRHLSMNADGTALSYVATKGSAAFLILNGKEEQLPAGELPWHPVIRPGGKGAGIIIAGQDGAYLHQAFYDDGIRSKRYKEAAELVYSDDGKQQAYGAIKKEKFLVVVNGAEGPLFDRVVKPQFTPNGKYIVYRARMENRRFVVVADSKGVVLHRHKAYEQIFDPVFTADGSSVAYGVKDGNKLMWIVEKM